MKNIVVFTGAGISAESGIRTYRDEDGLWTQHNHHEVASPEGWKKDRQKVLEFWNQLRKVIMKAQPNEAHKALIKLEDSFNTIIITQNGDDLHERAGSKKVLHLHGEIMKSRSSQNWKLVYDTNGKDINIGDRAEDGSQLRPNVVWFGEHVPLYEKALELVKAADVVLVVGTSLNVYPAANLVEKRAKGTPLYIVDPNIENGDYVSFRENATTGVPKAVELILEQENA